LGIKIPPLIILISVDIPPIKQGKSVSQTTFESQRLGIGFYGTTGTLSGKSNSIMPYKIKNT
jgi:hypothetical protein